MSKTEPDVSEFEAAQGITGYGCWHSRAHLKLDAEQMAKLDAALNRPNIQHAAICKVLKSWGFPANPKSVANHRKGNCSCA